MIVEVTRLVCMVANIRIVIVSRYFNHYRISEIAKNLEVLVVISRNQEVLRGRRIFSTWIDVTGEYVLPTLLLS